MSRAAFAVAAILAAGCGTDPPCPPATFPPLNESPAWAVVTSDYSSTAVALLDTDGDLLDEAWVDSGSAEAGIVAALSGDVTLPSAPLARGELTLIDRFGVDIISRFDLRAGVVLAQLRTQLDPSMGGGGYRANPQDALLDDGAILVSRLSPNHDPAAPELDRGNDLVRVDSTGPFDRVPLSALDVDVGGEHIYARPARMARLGAELVIGLARLDGDFKVGPGAVAVVSADRATVSSIDLPGLTNCPEVRLSPDDESVIVLCSGDPSGDAASRRPGAGVGRIVAGARGAELAEIWRAADHPTAPVPTGAPVPLGDSRVAIVTLGEGPARDQIAVLDLSTSEIRVGYEANGTNTLGVGAYDREAALLLLPDVEAGVLRFRVEDLALVPLGATTVSACRGLPAREVGVLLP